jgi:extracellular elastinolytic metalloproteinase
MMSIKPTDTPTTPITVGTYAINEPNTGAGIREFPYTTDIAINPRTLNSSNNPDNTTTGYRYTIGETWATVMWDLTWAYINKYGYDPDIYNGTGGNNKVMRLALDALKLHACNTSSFITTRDKLFAADQATTGGADYCMIAEVFRRRGVGLNASSGDINNSGDQVEDFTPFPAGPNCTLAVDYFDAKSQIRVYPNPSNGLYNVRINKFVGQVTIQVTDINGRVVYNQTDAKFNTEKTIDLSAFQSGIYVLKVTGNDLNYSEKLIKN